MNSKRVSYRVVRLLLFLIVVVIAHCLFPWHRPDPSSDFSRPHANEVAYFDCFSPPAVACTILHREAQNYVNLAVASTEGSAQIASALRGIQKLRKQLAELNSDLNRKLLSIYDANRLPNEIVDCYLDQLQAAPGSEAVLWATCVLECSSKCGRTAEVLDAMRHARRFHPEVQGLRGLDSVLDDWAAGHTLAQTP